MQRPIILHKLPRHSLRWRTKHFRTAENVATGDGYQSDSELIVRSTNQTFELANIMCVCLDGFPGKLRFLSLWPINQFQAARYDDNYRSEGDLARKALSWGIRGSEGILCGRGRGLCWCFGDRLNVKEWANFEVDWNKECKTKWSTDTLFQGGDDDDVRMGREWWECVSRDSIEALANCRGIPKKLRYYQPEFIVKKGIHPL